MLGAHGHGDRSHALSVFSDVVGWTYFLAWSISFYPQCILNYRRKSVVGLSFDFLMYNIQGYVCYSVFTIVAYVEQHRHDVEHSVEPNDIAFAVHGFAITAFTISQCLIYERGGQKINRIHMTISIFLWLLIFYNIILAASGHLKWYDAHGGTYQLSTVEFMGYVKAFISFIKYVPQAFMNWRRKSTVGWSIGNVLLDFTGGILSNVQQFVEAHNQRSWGVITSDMPKLLLATESLFFDVLFMVQHYILYNPHRQSKVSALHRESDGAEEYQYQRPLLEGSGDENPMI